MHQDWASRGLTILLFPCNQFGKQEPGTAAEITDFVKALGVPVDSAHFKMMEKVEVNGPGTHPVYTFLKAATTESQDIKWNFGSYWLVNSNGGIERLEGLKNLPKTFVPKIEAAVAR